MGVEAAERGKSVVFEMKLLHTSPYVSIRLAAYVVRILGRHGDCVCVCVCVCVCMLEMKLLEHWLREEVVESLQEVVLEEQRLEPRLDAEPLQRGDVLVGERERREPHQHLADVSTRQQHTSAFVSRSR